ncbi:MAG TPA: tripartite tricarboxylate transporter substrate binding protein [Ramlibacter sp.]|nr:tripartite tricarboxylate transporter substrate binding protein [Ramlibacter sp.]
MRHRLRLLLAPVAMAAMLGPWCAPAAFAQAWPSKPLRMIVPFPPGGPTDVVGRLFAQKLSEQLGQPVVVDNRPGGSGNIGAELAARAPADGYTILMGPLMSLATNHALDRKNLKYDLEKDLAPIAVVATVPLILVVQPAMPVQSVAEFTAYVKERPGQVTYGSGGSATPERLSAEMFRLRTGTNMLHVPYRGGPQIVQDLIGGQVHTAFIPLPPAIGQVQAGKLRPLAVLTPRRLPMLPNVPTMAEAGMPDFEVSTTSVIFAPAGTPRPIIERLNAELGRITDQADVKEKLLAQGGFVTITTPEQAAQKVRYEINTWGKVIRDANISPE